MPNVSKVNLKEKGRKPIMLTPSKEEHAIIRAAAGIKGIPMTQLVLGAALEASRKINLDYKKRPTKVSVESDGE